MSEQYIIQKESLVAIADAIREKKGTTAVFSPEQMALEIMGIDGGGNNLPNAEDTAFGTVDALEYGFTNTPTIKSGANQRNGHAGYTIKPNQDFAVYGVRLGYHYKGTYYVQIWDADTKTLLKEVTFTRSANAYTWLEQMLDTPVNMLAGKTYVYAAFCTYSSNCNTTPTINSKMSVTMGVVASDSKDVFPELATVTQQLALDMFIGAPIFETETTEYKIQVTTITDIADEIRRISGATGTITPAQMITLLKAVTIE